MVTAIATSINLLFVVIPCVVCGVTLGVGRVACVYKACFVCCS